MLVSGRNRRFIGTNGLLREQVMGLQKIHCPIVINCVAIDSGGICSYIFNWDVETSIELHYASDLDGIGRHADYSIGESEGDTILKYLLTINIIFPLISLTMVHADEVLWFYDFEEPPPGWGHYGFVFEDGSAHAYHNVYWTPDILNAKSDCACMTTEIVFIPVDMDSLVLDIPQYLDLYVSAMETGNASVKLEIEINGSDTHILWQQHIFAYSGTEHLVDSLPIHISLTDLEPGSFISFRLWATLSGYDALTIIDWLLEETQLTAYGKLELNTETWAGIKRYLCSD